LTELDRLHNDAAVANASRMRSVMVKYSTCVGSEARSALVVETAAVNVVRGGVCCSSATCTDSLSDTLVVVRMSDTLSVACLACCTDLRLPIECDEYRCKEK
jgi:hypothetical protein